jgi:uncharacterized membrane protein
MDNAINQNISNKKNILMRLIPYIFCFFIFSFVGWLLETIYCGFSLGRFVKRGFLYGALCPIYRNRFFNAHSIFK